MSWQWHSALLLRLPVRYGMCKCFIYFFWVLWASSGPRCHMLCEITFLLPGLMKISIIFNKSWENYIASNKEVGVGAEALLWGPLVCVHSITSAGLRRLTGWGEVAAEDLAALSQGANVSRRVTPVLTVGHSLVPTNWSKCSFMNNELAGLGKETLWRTQTLTIFSSKSFSNCVSE